MAVNFCFEFFGMFYVIFRSIIIQVVAKKRYNPGKRKYLSAGAVLFIL